jgi:Fibronectin type III domain
MLCSSTALSNALNAPSNLKATPISSTHIRLNWPHNSGNEAGFRVARSLDGTHFSLIASTGANATSYTNSGLMAARKYWYRIRAFNSSAVSQLTAVVSATTLSDNPTSTKKIIHWQAGTAGHNTLPSHILNNLAWIDSLPFDGLVCYWDVTYELLAPGNVASYSNIYNTWFAPIKGKLKHVTHNYVTVFTRRSADVFDDWTQVTANWSVMAQAARDGGFEGIFFDNECYYENVWIYPRDIKYGSTKTLSQYQEQFRLRGQQVMQAIIAQWPQAKVIIPHGPYASDSRTPSWISQMLPCQDANMSGFFCAGMFSAAPGHVIDGGENYQYRGSDFANSKTYRKNTQPNLSPNDVIPLSLKNSWVASDNISYGIYDRQYYSGPVMNPTVFTQCIVTGATQADELVWTYSEGRDFLTQGGVTQDWLDAVWSARSQLGLPPP